MKQISRSVLYWCIIRCDLRDWPRYCFCHIPVLKRFAEIQFDNAYMNRQISDTLEQYKILSYCGTFYLTSLSKDKVEMQEMNGYAVLLVAPCQDQKNCR